MGRKKPNNNKWKLRENMNGQKKTQQQQMETKRKHEWKLRKT